MYHIYFTYLFTYLLKIISILISRYFANTVSTSYQNLKKLIHVSKHSVVWGLHKKTNMKVGYMGAQSLPTFINVYLLLRSKFKKIQYVHAHLSLPISNGEEQRGVYILKKYLIWINHWQKRERKRLLPLCWRILS